MKNRLEFQVDKITHLVSTLRISAATFPLHIPLRFFLKSILIFHDIRQLLQHTRPYCT